MIRNGVLVTYLCQGLIIAEVYLFWLVGEICQPDVHKANYNLDEDCTWFETKWLIVSIFSNINVNVIVEGEKMAWGCGNPI